MYHTNINAIIWDYDGTLVDTRHKNMTVTRNIIESLTKIDASTFPALRTLDNYHSATRRISNWRELYRQEFHLSEQQIDEAGRMWTPFQLMDHTEAVPYRDLEAVIGELAVFPQGIVSQNSKTCIIRNLENMHLLPFFKHIVGYEEVELKKQKPDPDGLLSCIGKLSESDSGWVCYIGDHQTDTLCVQAANRVLQANDSDIKIISIKACYDSGADTATWDVCPDFEARKVTDILDIVKHIDRTHDRKN